MDILDSKAEKDLLSLNEINDLKLSATFKNEVLKKIDQEQSEIVYYKWFTPKVQIAAMLIVLFVNSIAIYQLFSNQQDSSLENFVEEYELKSTTIL